MSQPKPRTPVYIFLDPDGSGGDILGVIVSAKTGVEYGTQCNGVRCEERRMEGFFVPISGLRMNAEDGRIDLQVLTAVFHSGDHCLQDDESFDIKQSLGMLRNAVGQIPFWYEDELNESRRVQLQVDATRLDEAVEGWVPVTTPLGPGVLVWPNCD